MQWLHSLSTRARMQVLVLVTVTPIIILALLNSLDRRRFGEAEVRRDTVTMATRLAENMENQVAVIENVLRGVALKCREHDLGAGSVDAYLEEMRAQMPQLSNLAVVGRDGTVRYSVERPPGYRQVNVADTSWFKQVVASRSFVTSGYIVGRVTGKELTVFAYPVLAPDGTVSGVVYAAVNLDKLNRLFMREAPPVGYEVFLVDGDGIVLCTTEGSNLRVGRPLPDSALRSAIRAQQGSFKVADDEGVERIFFFKGVEGTTPRYAIGIGMPTALILGPINELLARSMILIGLVTLMSLYIGHFFSAQLIAQPIESLVGTAARIANGDLTSRTGLPVHDSELGRLAVALDEMAAALDERERCRLAMADSLRRSEEKYRLLFDTMPNGFALCEVIVDADGALQDCRFKEVNPAYEQLSGFERSIVVGKTFRELLPATAEDWLARFGAKVMSGALQKFTGYCPELTKYFEVCAHASLPGHLTVILNDVTETVATGEALRWKARVDAALAEVYGPLIIADSTLEAMAETILHQSRLLTESDLGYVSIVDPATGLVSSLAAVGYGPLGQGADRLSFAPAADGRYGGLRGQALNTGAGFYRNDLLEPAVPTGHPPLRRLLSAPVKLAHGPVGQIMLANGRNDYSARDLEAIGRLADLFALAIQRRWAEERVQRYQGQLKALATETFLIQGRERRHLAAVLHDQIGQNLALAMITNDRLGAAVTTTEQGARSREIKGLLADAIAATRSLTIEISPPVLHQLGLDAALESLVETFRGRYGLPVECGENEVPQSLSEESRLMLYHAVRELLMNVLKHAQAENVTVTARTEGELVRIVVADDGRGMLEIPRLDAVLKTSSYGLFSIRERLDRLGGSMQLETAPGQGTLVTLTVPLSSSRAESAPRPANLTGDGKPATAGTNWG